MNAYLDGSPTKAQQEVLALELLTLGYSCILQMPTGSGKTWLAEQAMHQVVCQGKRAVYLTPLRALADELFHRWRNRFSPHGVGVFTGDYKSGDYPTSFRDARLLILTPEKFDACTRNWRSHWSWLPEVDLVVVDEFHLLGEQRRGGKLEGALLRFTRLNPFARVAGLSATLGNAQELAEWLGGVAFESHNRPIPLEWRVVRYRRADQKPQLLLREINRNLAHGQSLVFVQSRRRAEALRKFLTEQGVKAQHHHAGLTHKARQHTEAAFRTGDIAVLVATATLEMGLNLPVRQVVLYDLQGFNGSEFVPLTVSTVWQRAGRAGRPHLDDFGEVVLLSPSWERSPEFYAKGQFEPISSALACEQVLAEQMIAEVASGLSRTQGQLVAAFAHSLAERQRCLPSTQGVLKSMLDAGLLVEVEAEERPRLKATRLGFISMRHHLMPETVLHLRRVLAAHTTLSYFDLLLMLTSTSDCEPLIPVDFEDLDYLAKAISSEPSVLLQHSREEIRGLLGVDGKRLLAALNTALVARSWTRLGTVEALVEEHGCYPSEVTRLQESLVRLLHAAHAVAGLHPEDRADEHAGEPNGNPLAEKIQALIHMVGGGLNEEAVTLTQLSGLGTTLAKRLNEAGIRNIEELALARPEELASIRGISRKRSDQWIREAERLRKTFPIHRYRETATPQPALITAEGWSSDADPYRLRRALELHVAPHPGGIFRVSGGLEPHTVRQSSTGYCCDCADRARDKSCKHVLAVRLAQGDAPLKELARKITTPYGACLNLMELWMKGHVP